MSVTTLALLVVPVAIITALLLARPVSNRAAGEGGLQKDLRHRFGPEYDRVTAHHHGDPKAAERELAARLRHFHALRLKELPEPERAQYRAQWAGLQEQFVDCPGAVAAKANLLLNRLAVDRGFPAESRARQFEALSVHHPEQVEGARLLDAAARQAGTGTGAGTDPGTSPGMSPGSGTEAGDAETMRHAMIAGRALFDVLIAPQAHPSPSPHAAHRTSF
ncbi:hypothetical protein [Streptomyces sp. NPDC059092]|uniref:hypothetical protein n=1 Tax=Streptomyces sp. NPDC059092 TaxID=3346725 RepID=UPI003686D70C